MVVQLFSIGLHRDSRCSWFQ